MRKVLFAFILLMATGCGKQDPAKVDTELRPYFDRFAQSVGKGTEGVSGSFASLKAPTAAVCSIRDGYRAIQVDRAYWDAASEDAREETIFHELGHCALFLKHIEALDTSGCPVSIMNPYTFGNTWCYYTGKAHYYQELASHR